MYGIETRPGAHGCLRTGLSAGALGGIVALTTVFFLLWEGPLWDASPRASHVARIGLSYLVAVPLVHVALVRARAWSVERLITATFVVWAVKLLLTSTLFTLLVGGTARYTPERPWARGLRDEAHAPSVRGGTR